MQKFNNLGKVVTDNKKCDTEMLKYMRITKDSFRKLSNVLGEHKMSFETKKTKTGLDFLLDFSSLK